VQSRRRVKYRGSRPSAENRFVVRRVKEVPPDLDYARTVIRTPAPTLPPGISQEFVAQNQPSDGFVAGPGKTIAGKYCLGEKVAQGTFGVVFTAKDQHLDRDVAIKLLNAAHISNKEIVQRFLQEARAAARIAHPGIVTMFDCGLIEGSSGAYIAMELLQGESLTARLHKAGRLAPAVAIELARQVACALDAAHKASVLHRDLKPDNIYVVPDPATHSGERVKVLDFGLAKLGNNGQTQMHTVFGTPRYMSPEQCRSATQIDHRSDIYALGCILFELVTGRTPFEGSLRELVDRHQRAPIPRASSFSMEVSPALDDVILMMLQKDPALRPQTMAAVQRMLKSVEHDSFMHPAAHTIALGSGPRAFVPPPTIALAPARSSSWPRLRRAPILAAAIAFVVAGALTAIAARGPAKAKAALPTAQVVSP
jgi:serine/threonine protein kinase